MPIASINSEPGVKLILPLDRRLAFIEGVQMGAFITGLGIRFAGILGLAGHHFNWLYRHIDKGIDLQEAVADMTTDQFG